MKTFNYEDLKEYVDSSKGRVAVVMVTDHCSQCANLLDYVQHNLIPKYTDVEFISFNTDDIPLFAPPVIPSIIFFLDGLRSYEGHGFPDPPNTIDQVIDWWKQNIKK